MDINYNFDRCINNALFLKDTSNTGGVRVKKIMQFGYDFGRLPEFNGLQWYRSFKHDVEEEKWMKII
jgi:hypothetical protein